MPSTVISYHIWLQGIFTEAHYSLLLKDLPALYNLCSVKHVKIECKGCEQIKVRN